MTELATGSQPYKLYAERVANQNVLQLVYSYFFSDRSLWMKILNLFCECLCYGSDKVLHQTTWRLSPYSSEGSTVASTLVTVDVVLATAELLSGVLDAYAKILVRSNAECLYTDLFTQCEILYAHATRLFSCRWSHSGIAVLLFIVQSMNIFEQYRFCCF